VRWVPDSLERFVRWPERWSFKDLRAGYISINTKVALLLAGMLVLSSLAVSLVTARSVTTALGEASEKAADSVLDLAMLWIESEHANLSEHKEFTLKLRREQMQNLSGAVASALDSFFFAKEQGLLSEAAARKLSLDYLRGVRYGNEDYFFTYDRQGLAIAHPDPKVQDKDMSRFKDAKGRMVLDDIRALASSPGRGFLDIWFWRLNNPEPVPKLIYIALHPKWDWILGTGVYIDDVEEEAKRKLSAIKERLKEAFDKVHIAKSGFVFVVDGTTGQMVVAPKALDLTFLKHTFKGKDLMAALIQGANEAGGRFAVTREEPVLGGKPAAWTFKARSFEPLHWYVVSAVPRAEIEGPGRGLVLQQTWINLGILVLSLVVGSFMARRLTRPLRTLNLYARDLPVQEFVLSDQAVAAIEGMRNRNRDEVGSLAGSFLAMERALQRYIADLTRTTASKERIESELRIARDIQMGILPKLFPPFPDRPEFDIFASIEPAREVGGDLYDFFFIDQDTFCFLIGDVSDKGVPAAFFMAVCRTLLKVVAGAGLTPGDILSKTNNDLSEKNDSCMFVTLFLALLNVRTGELSYASAGHNPPVLLPAGGAPRWLTLPREPVAGAMPGVAYTTSAITLDPGDMLFLYTDGVSEAMNARNDIYSDERLIAELAADGQGSAADLVHRVKARVAAFTGGAEQSDDITMLAFKYAGPGPRS
jgi:sigma-B regulation protein RsbU (phosphoserine phosphatase)